MGSRAATLGLQAGCRLRRDCGEWQAVVRLLIDGSWITVARSYVVADHASDGRAHFCGNLHMNGNNPVEVKPEPICVILPPRET